MKAISMLAAMVVVLAASTATAAQPTRAVTRGELLYSTHCIACHTSEVHWRDKKLARDWVSLNSQVRRWQENADLKWSDDDIAEAARFLNSSYYHFPEPDD